MAKVKTKGLTCLSGEIEESNLASFRKAYKHAWYIANKNKIKDTPKPKITRISWDIEKVISYIKTFYPASRVLSTVYINNSSKLQFSCSQGHVFTMALTDVQGGHWCPYCAGCKKLTVFDIKQKLAALHPGAIFLAGDYKNNKTKLDIKCEHGHIIAITWHDIDQGYWCGKCSSGKSERACRDIFELILNKSFEKTRIYYDKNNFRYFYEIDGFCQELGLGFEYQGRQHYEYTQQFHRDDKQGHIKQQNRDKEKIAYLISLGYYIIEIPYTIKRNKIKLFIEKELELWQKLKQKV